MALRHFVLMKFEAGWFGEETLRHTREVFQEIREQVPGVLGVQVFGNCVERDTNCDLMVQMDLADPSVLPAYLGHPLHRAYAGEMTPHLTQRVSFDHAL